MGSIRKEEKAVTKMMWYNFLNIIAKVKGNLIASLLLKVTEKNHNVSILSILVLIVPFKW